jgi:hypothetical protein
MWYSCGGIPNDCLNARQKWLKDVVLLAVSIYLLKQDVMRVCVQSGACKLVGEPVQLSVS